MWVQVTVALCAPGAAWAFDETTSEVRRTTVDAGVHVPVLTKAPALLEFAKAVYPADAQAQGLTSAVKLLVTILPDGSVGEVSVREPVGNGFDEAAIEALHRFRFSPAELDNVPAAVQIEYVYHFVLDVPVDAGPGDAGAEPVDAGPPPNDATIIGTVIARGSRKRVPAAIAQCDNWPDLATTSDEQGKFVLNVPSGDCALRIAATDFMLYQTKQTLEHGETKEVNYFLIPKVAGYQTVVRGERDKQEVVRRSFSREEVSRIPGTFGDPIRVIQNFPGVARAPFGLGQLIVRGANPSQTLTYFDGVQIPLLFHLGGGPSIVNADFLDRVDFFPGGFGARYGRAVGGVVDVASRRGASDTWHGAAKVDLLDSSIFFEAPLAEGVSVAAAARRSYIDALLPAVLPKAFLVLPVYWDYQVRLDVGGKKGEKQSDGSSYSLFAFGSDDTLKLISSVGNRGISLDTHTLFHRIVGTWLMRKGDTTFKLTPYVGYDLASVDFGIAKLNADTWTGGMRADLGVEVSPWLTVRTGADIFDSVLVGSASIPTLDGVQYISFPGADPRTTTQQIAETVNTFDGALYAEADLSVGKLTVTPGLRGSMAFLAGQTRNAWDPRLWARYQFTEATSLKGSLGLYTQPPAATSMLAPPFGTPSLTHERAFQSSLGVAHRFTEFINVDVTGFYNRRYENVSSPGPTVVAADGTVTQYRNANDGLGRAYGVEVLARHEVSKYFFGWIAYTLSRSEQRTAHTSDPYVLSTFDQTHILTLIGSVRLPYGFEIGVRFRYVTGRPKTPLDHQADVFQADDYSYSATFGATRSIRQPDFHQLDVRIDKNFILKNFTLDLYLDIQNVYNQANTEATFYDYRFRTEFNVPGIPFLPVIGLKASF